MGNEDKDEDIEIGSGKSSTFKEVIMNQLSKITNNSNVEFRGGYYTIVQTKMGEREIYVQDTREVFNNGVFCFAMLLKKKYDKEMDKNFEEFKKDLETLKAAFIKKSTVDEDVILGEGFYQDNDKIALEEYKQKKLALHIKLFGYLCDLLARKRYLEITGGVF